MRSSARGLLIAALLLPATLAWSAEPREWSDVTGKFKITAEFVELTDGIVKLRNADGKILKIPLAKLSPDDRRAARELSAPPAAPEMPGPLTSLVRVIVPLMGPEGEEDELTLVGFAIQTSEPAPVIVVSKLTLPKGVDEEEFRTGMVSPLLLALRSEEEYGNAGSSGMLSMGDGRGGDGRGGEMMDDGGRSGRPAAETPLAPVADEASANLIILRAPAEARIPMLKLAAGPPAAGETVTVARLPRPQVRAGNAPKPPIPWTPWTVLASPQMQTAFTLKPQDNLFPYTATLPILNSKQEVVGVLNPGAQALPDKSRVASAIGLGPLQAALAQAGIQPPAPATPPPIDMAGAGQPGAAPPAGGNPLASFFSRFVQPPGAAAPPAATDAAVPNPDGSTPPPTAPPADRGAIGPWRTSYEGFAAGISATMGRDGRYQFTWGEAADFGAWYDEVLQANVAKMELANSGGRDPSVAERVAQHEQNAAAALARLQGVEWTAVVSEMGRGAGLPAQLALPALPSPLSISFVPDAAEADTWSRIYAGDRITFGCRFSVLEGSDPPTIQVTMTLKGPPPR